MTHRAVHRTNVEITDATPVALPYRAHLLHVAPCRRNPNTHIDLWYETDPARDHWRTHTLHFEGTGHPLVDDALYVGTVVCPNDLVWHVYLDAATRAVDRP